MRTISLQGRDPRSVPFLPTRQQCWLSALAPRAGFPSFTVLGLEGNLANCDLRSGLMDLLDREGSPDCSAIATKTTRGSNPASEGPSPSFLKRDLSSESQRPARHLDCF